MNDQKRLSHTDERFFLSKFRVYRKIPAFRGDFVSEKLHLVGFFQIFGKLSGSGD